MNSFNKPGAVCPGVLRVVVGKPLADVSESGRAQQRVGDRMQQHVGMHGKLARL